MTLLRAQADSPIEHGYNAMKHHTLGYRPALRQLATALLVLAAGVAMSGPAAAQSSVKILVNDQPITTFDIKTRTQMVKVFSQGREGEKAATEQLIEERLKAQEAKLRGISVSDEEVEREFAQRAAQLKLQPAQFTQAMQQAGISPTDFRRFLKTNMEWAALVRARFRAQVKISDQDVVAALGKKGDDAAAVPNTASEYMLQQIVFVVPKGAGQAVENQRKSEANAFRGRFQGCQQALESARGLNGVVVKPPVRRDDSQLQDNTAAALASMQVGETTAPERTADGFQVLAICAKNAISGAAASNEELRSELANERGQLLARRYLRDLRADAVIEYR
jgi:peptidyl-prolyl cis-trans isomerase SurA